jgi:hypothetical protein
MLKQDELLQERNEGLDLFATSRIPTLGSCNGRVLNLDVPDGVILERIEGTAGLPAAPR